MSSDCDVQSRVAFLPLGGTSPKYVLLMFGQWEDFMLL
jgi:hypothetical protein